MNQPNIISFHGGSNEPPDLYLVTEYLEGSSLWDVLHDKRQELPWDLRLRIATEVAQGMAYLHEKNVIHRDLKSESIVLINLGDPASNQVVAKISDLGIARWKQPIDDVVLTMGRGTPQWSTTKPLAART